MISCGNKRKLTRRGESKGSGNGEDGNDEERTATNSRGNNHN